MLVNSRKIPVKLKIENACPRCDGAGKLQIVPLDTRLSPFDTVCDNCHGEKVMSKDLIDRAFLATELRDLLKESDLSLREAAQKFSQSFREWIDCRAGRAPAEMIQAKIDLLKVE